MVSIQDRNKVQSLTDPSEKEINFSSAGKAFGATFRRVPLCCILLGNRIFGVYIVTVAAVTGYFHAMEVAIGRSLIIAIYD